MEINLEEITHHASWVLAVFLIGYLAIVEIINAHKGFRIITEKLMISSKLLMLFQLSWIISRPPL